MNTSLIEKLKIHLKFLENFSGTLISDGYGGYNNIAGAVNAYCWAHARRKFYEALPADMKDVSDTLVYTGLKKIAKLFAIEKEIDTFPPEEKVKIRQKKSKPLVDDFFFHGALMLRTSL